MAGPFESSLHVGGNQNEIAGAVKCAFVSVVKEFRRVWRFDSVKSAVHIARGQQDA
jgi:hypothetical protein